MKTVTYQIQGKIKDDGRPWAPFSSDMAITDQKAITEYERWKQNRDAAGFDFQYRLVRHTTEMEVVATEVPEEVRSER